MGCTVSNLCGNTMSLFGKRLESNDNIKANLERKLYLAKESPEPVFDLSECHLKEVPSGIYSICKVYRKDHLNLSNNRLSSLEDGGNLNDLYLIKMLNISCNNFYELPNSIKYLVNLTELYIQNNALKFIPDTIKYLESLTILDVSKNKLKELTPSIGKLKNLRTLNLVENPSLNRLCPELCFATNIISLELDGNNFVFPPSDIACMNTEDIIKYLCEQLNVEYVAPIPASENASPIQTPKALLDPFVKIPVLSWEEQEAAIIEQENRLHQASKEQKNLFLSNVLKEQSDLDAEIAKVQELRESDRQKLINIIQEDEKEIELLVNQFIQSTNLDPEVIQQQLQYEQEELNRLLDITRQYHTNVTKTDTLNAMETLIEENFAFQLSKKNYDQYMDNMKRNMLAQELECAEKVEELLRAKDESHTVLVKELLEDQDIQKALVATLLEKVDTRSWSLNQEIAIITANLAKLSIIEQEKQKLHVNYNFNQLLYQRTQLLNVLDDLLEQQNKRRLQLIETLKEMESEEKTSADFWLKNYQKLMESVPRSLLEAGKSLDPQLANNLIQEGVIHCLPFLVKFLFSKDSLLEVTDEKLRGNGVQLSCDRESILRAIQEYVVTKVKLSSDTETQVKPSAPDEESTCVGVVDNSEVESNSSQSECVICMDAKCEVVFVPCGHMCCCLSCCDKELQSCPMCRGDIERKIKVLVP